MVSSEGKCRADVWSAEASLNFEDVDVPADEGGGVDDADVAELLMAIIDAVAMDSRERTRSSGYVVPASRKKMMFEKLLSLVACQIGRRTDRSDTGQSTAGQSGGGIQLFLPI